jgi:hypothetical protein
LEAATTGLEEAREDFFGLTRLYPENINENDFDEIGCTINDSDNPKSYAYGTITYIDNSEEVR